MLVINYNFEYLKIEDYEHAFRPNLTNAIVINVSKLTDAPWMLASSAELDLVSKIANFPKLDNIGKAWAGIITGSDEVLMLDKDKVKQLGLEEDILLPLIRGKDPQRFSYTKASKYVIYPYKVTNKTTILSESELQERYPKCYEYLLKNKNKLMKRKDSRKLFSDQRSWYGLIRFGTIEVFNKVKIVTPGEVKAHKFALDVTGSGFSCARVFAITIDNPKYDIKYILGLLNSSTIRYYLQHKAPLKQGGFYTYSSTILNQIPIKEATKAEQDVIIKRVDRILSLNELTYNSQVKNSDLHQNMKMEIENLEKEINEAVYNMYGINSDEQKTIEKFIRQSES